MIDKKKGNRVINFIERICTHVAGPKAGDPFILEQWQKEDIIHPIYSNVDDEGNRIKKEIYLEIPRKNGKSALMSCLALWHLFDPDTIGGQVISAAADRSQASIIFNAAKQICLNSLVLMQQTKVMRNSIINLKTNTNYQVVSADAPRSLGLSCTAVFMDELLAQPNRELYDVLRTSQGTHKNPIFFSISTAGYDTTSICYEVHDYTNKVNNGVIEDVSFYGKIYSASKDDDPFDSDTWKKANPNYGISVQETYLEEQSRKAQNIGSTLNSFLKYHLNIWVSSSERWLKAGEWAMCGDTFDKDMLLGADCYAGLDLSKSHDLSSLVLYFPDVDGKNYIIPFFWIPEESIKGRSMKKGVNYDVWERNKFIEATEGNIIDYGLIKKRILEINDMYNIIRIGYDRKYATELILSLFNEHGIDCSEVAQGSYTWTPAIVEMENQIKAKTLQHGGNPILTWNVDNAVILFDENDNKRWSRRKSSEKIDGIVALCNAMVEYLDDRKSDDLETEIVFI